HTVKTRFESGSLPPGKNAIEVARTGHGGGFSDSRIGDQDYRVYTIPAQFRDTSGNTYALQVARSLDEVDHTLHEITFFLILIALGGIAIAGGLGLAVAQAALAPVRRLTRRREG